MPTPRFVSTSCVASVLISSSVTPVAFRRNERVRGATGPIARVQFAARCRQDACYLSAAGITHGIGDALAYVGGIHQPLRMSLLPASIQHLQQRLSVERLVRHGHHNARSPVGLLQRNLLI